MPAKDIEKKKNVCVCLVIPLIYFSFCSNILGVTVTSGTPTGQAERVVTTVPQYSIAPPYYYEQGQNTYQVCIYDINLNYAVIFMTDTTMGVSVLHRYHYHASSSSNP